MPSKGMRVTFSKMRTREPITLQTFEVPPSCNKTQDPRGAPIGLPCRLFPLVLVQVGGGEVCGLTTGAKALFCFTAETMLAGEKEKIPEELLQLEGRLVEEAIVGLDGTTRVKKKRERERVSLNEISKGNV